MSRHGNSGYIGKDKRTAKAGVYGLKKHYLERLGGNFLLKAPSSSFDNKWSLLFDGADDYLEVASSADLNSAGDITISAWIKPDSSSTNFKFIWTKVDSGESAGNRQYSLYIRNGAYPCNLSVYGGGIQLNSVGTVEADVWSHVAVTIESGATNGVKLYINGSAETLGTMTVSSHDSTFFIGRREDSNYEFAGNIDEVGVWRSVLSASDVGEIYNSGTPTDLAPYSPLYWWRMGDTQSPTVDTSTPTSVNNNGSVSGATAALNNGPLYKEDVPS